MRKNIFEILANHWDIDHEISKIYELLIKSDTFLVDEIIEKTVAEVLDEYYFHNWKQRNRCVSCKDMISRLNIEKIALSKNKSLDDILLFLEFVLNMLNLCGYVLKNNKDDVDYNSNYCILNNNTLSLCDHLNLQVQYFDKQEKVILIEKNAAATAAAEIVDDDLSLKVIQYNHFLLKGDIQEKKNIILALANKIEPNRKELEGLNKTLASDLFYLLNNMDLRHNNKSKSDKNFKEYVAKMKKSQLESWYDETYQLELLALLLLDNKKATVKIQNLKQKMNGVTTDGQAANA